MSRITFAYELWKKGLVPDSEVYRALFDGDDARLERARDITAEVTVVELDPRDVAVEHEGGRITKAVVLR